MLTFAALPLLLALQSAPPAPPVAAEPPRPESPLAEAPLKVEFRVSGAKPDVMLMSGQLQARPFSTAGFEQRLAKSLEEMKMSVVLKPQRDGEVAVDLQWEEGTAEGHVMHWAMSLMGKLGTPLVGTVAWPGDSRTVTVTVR